MKTELDKLIRKIQDGIAETFQSDVFDDDSKHNVLIEACKEFFKHKGYKVIEPVKCTYNVKKLDDLIHLFYALSDSKHPESMNKFRDMVRDRKIASLFVETRMNTSDINKKEALKECASIIEVIFKHENEFNFNIPLVFGMLGQKKLGWITEKAVSIINKKKQNSENERRAEILSVLDEYYDAETSSGFGDLTKILKNL